MKTSGKPQKVNENVTAVWFYLKILWFVQYFSAIHFGFNEFLAEMLSDRVQACLMNGHSAHLMKILLEKVQISR